MAGEEVEIGMNARRDLLWLVIVTAGAPALGQAPSPAAVTAAASAASIPDLSGVWAHPGVGFGLQLSGPGPVRNKSRLPSGQSNSDQLVGDYTNPILKPAAAEVIKRNGEIQLAGRSFPDPDSQCLQNPVPYIFWNFTLRMLQLPDKVVLVYDHDDDYREVPLNRPHPATVVPSVHGDSVGHYEGDTLVIDTVGVKLGPYRTIDRFGTPYTEALHVVERYRRIDYEATKEALARAAKEWRPVGVFVDPNYRGKGLQLEFTVEDPGVFTMPWSATITYGRKDMTEWEERVCAENVQHEYDGGFFSDKDAHIPTAAKPDF
jgi:GNAT superfamily N-acetyltransferase